MSIKVQREIERWATMDVSRGWKDVLYLLHEFDEAETN